MWDYVTGAGDAGTNDAIREQAEWDPLLQEALDGLRETGYPPEKLAGMEAAFSRGVQAPSVGASRVWAWQLAAGLLLLACMALSWKWVFPPGFSPYAYSVSRAAPNGPLDKARVAYAEKDYASAVAHFKSLPEPRDLRGEDGLLYGTALLMQGEPEQAMWVLSWTLVQPGGELWQEELGKALKESMDQLQDKLYP